MTVSVKSHTDHAPLHCIPYHCVYVGVAIVYGIPMHTYAYHVLITE